MSLPDPLIKKILLNSGFVSKDDIKVAEKYASAQERLLLDVMIERGVVLENSVGQILASFFSLPYMDLKNGSIEENSIKALDEDFAVERRVVVLKKQGDAYLVAIEDPTDLVTKEFVERCLGKVKWYFSLSSSINYALDQYHQNIQEDIEETIRKNIQGAAGKVTVDEMPISKIFDSILRLGASRLASDVHIENTGEKTLVRFRVDGALRDILSLPTSVHEALVTRVKIISNLRIDEHRVPQDGRFRFFQRQEDVSVRASILPTLHGEDINLRLLFQSSRPKSLEELGLSGRNLEVIKKALTLSHGLILATGPTGSGKTTTLYNMINVLNSQSVNIITIEDPIEYTLPRVTQIQVNNQTGLTFASGLRSILRHDPNIILVGEIRDKETADLATQAALTGHAVFSSLHTDSAVDAIPRLFDLGIEPYLISTTLATVISQRLVKRIHQKCVTLRSMNQEDYNLVKKYWGESEANLLKTRNFKIPAGLGCDSCNHTGFSGRIGIFEVLVIGEEIKTLIPQKSANEQILSCARKGGYTTMVEDGIDKVSSGLTTLTEVFQAVLGE